MNLKQKLLIEIFQKGEMNTEAIVGFVISRTVDEIGEIILPYDDSNLIPFKKYTEYQELKKSLGCEEK